MKYKSVEVWQVMENLKKINDACRKPYKQV